MARWLNLLVAAIGLICLIDKGAAAVCGTAFSCTVGYGKAAPDTACTICGSTECCKPLGTWMTISAEPNFTPARQGHCTVSVGGVLLLLAGKTGASFSKGTYLSDAWTASSTGTAWALRNPAASFQARAYHSCAVLGTTAYVIGGWNGQNTLNDVWSTSDVGVSFAQLTAAASFPPRDAFGAVGYNSLLFVVAGWNNGAYLNDVWSSSNGATWTEVTPAAAFSGREAFGLVVYKNLMWLIAGGTATSVLNEVWVSDSTGATWTLVGQDAPFQPRAFAMIGAFHYFLLCGGDDPTNPSALCWASDDGKTWVGEPSLPGPLKTGALGFLSTGLPVITGGKNATAVVSTQYNALAFSSCYTTGFTCPMVYSKLTPLTLCSGQTCTSADCCSTSLVASASQYLVIVLSVDCSLYTPTTFAVKIAQATGIPVEAIVITYFGCSSLTVYLTVLGSTTALADAALALVAQIALSGVLGPVVTVYFTTSPAPAPTPTTTTTTYPTVPIFRPIASSSNPALLGLLALLILPLLCCWLIFLRPRQQCCMAAPVCCAAAPQPMAPYMGGC